MGLVVNTNVTSLIAQRNLKKNSIEYQNSLERMSTGYQINKASDNPTGMAIAKVLEMQIAGIDRASNNAQDGTNLLQIAESSYNIIAEDLQRIRELTIQAANSTNSSNERIAISQEIRSRIKDISDIAESTSFNNISLLGSSSPTTSGYKLMIGPDLNDFIDIAPALGNARATALNANLLTSIDLSAFSNGQFSQFIANIDSAINNVTTKRASLGAFQTQLDNVVNNLQINNINVSAAKSRIKDINMGNESAEMVKKQIMRDAAVSVLAQSNNIPKLVLGLLQSS